MHNPLRSRASHAPMLHQPTFWPVSSANHVIASVGRQANYLVRNCPVDSHRDRDENARQMNLNRQPAAAATSLHTAHYQLVNSLRFLAASSRAFSYALSLNTCPFFSSCFCCATARSWSESSSSVVSFPGEQPRARWLRVCCFFA